MNKIILTLICTLPALALAEPSSQVAWTAEQINFIKSGDAQRGQDLAKKSCASCHGENGISTSGQFPSLAGQLPTYLYKQLMDYKNGNRANAMMGVATGLSEQEAADLAAWFASQPPAYQSRSPMVYEQAEALVKNGNRDRILPPCEVCHGKDGKGQDMDMPALSGQHAEYISATLKAFKSDQRTNDIYSRMRLIAKELTDQEIKELGSYYQNIKN